MAAGVYQRPLRAAGSSSFGRFGLPLGKSPLSYFQDLRVEHAQALLHGGMDLEAVAAQVGYIDGATLGALLRQRTGRGVRDLRADLR